MVVGEGIWGSVEWWCRCFGNVEFNRFGELSLDWVDLVVFFVYRGVGIE